MKFESAEAKLVRLVLERPALTRYDLSRLMQTSLATVAALVRTLSESGALVQSGNAVSTGGRPAAKLSVSPMLGHCFAHQILEGRLASCAINARGKVLAQVDRPIDDVAGCLRGVDAAEMELSVKIDNGPTLASGLVVPGFVDLAANKGVAPWLFGIQVFDPGAAGYSSRLVSGAGALIGMRILRLGEEFTGRWVALDMAGGLSGLLVTDRMEPVPLDLTALEPPPEIISRDQLETFVLAATSNPCGLIARKSETMSITNAFLSAEAEGDERAGRIFDELLAKTAAFARTACRALRPRKLIVTSWLIGSGSSREAVANVFARRCGLPLEDVILVSPAEATEHRWVGAGLAALDMRLAALENGTKAER